MHATYVTRHIFSDVDVVCYAQSSFLVDELGDGYPDGNDILDHLIRESASLLDITQHFTTFYRGSTIIVTRAPLCALHLAPQQVPARRKKGAR